MGERLAYRGYAAAAGAAAALPERVGSALFRWGGRAGFRALPQARATVAENMSRVLGRPPDSDLVQAITREAFDLYARYWYDTFRVRRMRDGVFAERTVFEGAENIDAALEKGVGAVVTTPHLGNWDVAGHWLHLHGYRLVAVAEALRPRRLLELFLEHREELGMKILTLTPDGNVGRRLAQHLSENWIVALVADRELSGGGVEVEMFGEKRKMPAGPAMLAITTGAPVLLCSSYTTERGWKVRIHPPLEYERTGNTKEDVVALTRRIASEFERLISARPADWHMFQPAW